MVTNYIVNIVANIYRIILAALNISPGITGEKRLFNLIIKNLKNADIKELLVSPSGIKIGTKWMSKDLEILKFIKSSGILIKKEKIPSDYFQLRKLILSSTDIDKKFYHAFGLYALTTIGTVFCNYIIITKIINVSATDSWIRAVFSAAWLVPNTYFLIQLFIFHYTKLETIRITNFFREAETQQEEAFTIKDIKPNVLSVIPSYMEDAQLICNSLYSHCFQRYPNKEIVLLLGNDFYTKKAEVLQNTQKNLEAVESVKAELRQHRTHIENIMGINLIDSFSLGSQTYLKFLEVYTYLSNWFQEKSNYLSHLEDRYPTLPFLLENTFNYYSHHFKQRANYCSNKAHGKVSQGSNHESEEVKEFLEEIKSIYNARISVFQRYKYVNVEHERTKAGNLTAYLSLLDKNWKEVINPDGTFSVSILGENKKREVDYVGVFDTDTINKPQYLWRKIIFMEQKENKQIGLVQSPYNVPVPEPTIPASASGVHSHWFLPISIGLTAYNSAFWLGFNGLFRAQTIHDIKGSFIADTLIEDLETSLKIIKSGYSIFTSPEYQCQTFSPPDMYGVQVQRKRWASGGFKIAFEYIKDSLKGNYKKASLIELLLRMNYIIGLNLLPLVITVTLILEYPYYQPFYGIETVPFFLYLMTYAACIRPYSYKLKNYLDGLAISIFMNFHYLRGTWTSFKLLLKKNSAQEFKATPRSRKSNFPLGHFELLGFCFLLPYLINRIINDLNQNYYWDIYPLFQIFCIFYGCFRLIGWKETFKNIYQLLKIKQ